MQYPPYQFDLPLSQLSRPPKSIKNPHIPNKNYSDSHAFDLPRQLAPNPYNHIAAPSDGNSQMTKGVNSISKCAVTEMSSHDDEQQSESLAPICQKLFSNCHCLDSDIDLQQTQRNGDTITEATFKPNELKQYLTHQNRTNPKLRKILQQTMFKRSSKDCGQRRAISCRANETSKSKTKYQRILEQYYRQKPKVENIKKRASLQNVPNFKLKHRQTAEQQSENENVWHLQTNNGFKREPIRDITNKYYSQNMFPLESTPIQNKTMQKTFSTQKIRAQSTQTNRSKKYNAESTETRSGPRTNVSKPQNEPTNKVANLRKKYTTTIHEPPIPECKLKSSYNTAGSYAKLYYDKIKLKK